MAIMMVAILAVCLGAVNSRLVEVGTCDNVSTACTIHEVRIEPCKVTKANKPCVVKKQQNTSIAFEYTTDFSAEKLENMVYLNRDNKPTFSGIGYDACPNTVCPAEAGKRQSYLFLLKPSKILPDGVFPIEWKLWNANNASQLCCFTSEIRLS